MDKYVNLEPLINALKTIQKRSEIISVDEVLDVLAKYPAADVTEVVRCENCKWLEKWYKELPPYDTGLYCTRPNQQSINLLPTDYCSYGVRKDG